MLHQGGRIAAPGQRPTPPGRKIYDKLALGDPERTPVAVQKRAVITVSFKWFVHTFHAE